MNKAEINRYNKVLGDSLGLVASGTLPRFAWKHSTEIPMLAEKIGERWLLTEWRRPSMTHADWVKSSGGRHPYPASGWYHPYIESALPVGMDPTADLTQKAIYKFDEQMSVSFANQMIAVNNEIERDHGYVQNADGSYRHLTPEEDCSQDRRNFIDKIQSDGEAFCNPAVGKTAFPQFMGRKASEGFVGI